MPESCYLVDAYSLIYQVFHAIPGMTGPKGQPTNAVFGFTGDMLRLRKRKPDYLVVVFDAPGKTFRDALYADYKANRPPPPDDLQSQFPLIRRMLDTLNIPSLEVPGYEADDVLATLAAQAAQQGMDVFLVSGDKDCRQLLSDRVKIYNVRKDAVLDEAGLKQDWGITPSQVVDYLSLVGDNVDNVKGVPGIGPKTAARLLQESGNIEGIYADLAKMKAGKLRDSLAASREVVDLGRRLITLARDVPVTADWEKWRLGHPDVPAFLDLCRECGFHRYASEMREEQKLAAQAAPSEPRQGELFPAATTPDDWQAHYLLVDTPEKLGDVLTELKRQKRLAIDLETTSLEPLRADIVGYAVCWEEGSAYYLAVRGPAGQPTLDPAATLEALRPILESPDIAKLNQNIKYDLLVLRRAGVHLAGVAGDSMIADYLLAAGERRHNLDDLSQRWLRHTPIPITDLLGKGRNQKRMDQVHTAKVAEYAAEDADIAFRLCARLEPELERQGLAKLYRELEIPLIEVLADMEYTGIKVDLLLLQKLSTDFAERAARLEEEIYRLAGRRFNIASLDQLRQVLFEELKLPALRRTGITRQASTAQDVLEELAAQGHDLPRRIVEFRQIAKLKSTYVDALPALVNPATGRIHASFNQTVAATGRLSSSDPNLQNIPVRSQLGEQIRQAFTAGEPGGLLLSADYSQVELRILAHLSGDKALCKAFAEDRDIHAAVASQVFGVPEAEVSKEQRRMAKVVNFGVIYGLSAFGLAKTLGLDTDEAAAFIDHYFAKYPGVARFQQELLDNCRKDGYVSTILGRRRAIEGIRPQSSYRQRNQPEREALNTVIQGSAADLIKQAMLNIYHRLRRERRAARMLLQIHDELVFDVPASERDDVARLVAEEMASALPLSVPLKVDLAAGPNWLQTGPLE